MALTKDRDGYTCWSTRWLAIHWQWFPEHCRWLELTINATSDRHNDYNYLQLRLARLFSGKLYIRPLVKPTTLKLRCYDGSERIEKINRRWGFQVTGDSLDYYHLYYGNDPMDDSFRDHVTAQRKSWRPGYADRRLTEWTVFAPQGTVYDQHLSKEDCRGSAFFVMCDASRNVPKRKFTVIDYDGQEIIGSYHVVRRAYSHGDGWFRWLSWFRKPLTETTVSIEFNDEVGNDKGSYKGGLMGLEIPIIDGETAEQAIVRWIQEERSKDNADSRHRVNLRLKSWGTTEENQ